MREEYKRGFGVPTLIAVHRENDPQGEGWDIAKAYACGLGSDKAGVLESSFVAEVKSDLMGEQTILCGMLQAGSLICYDKMIAEGIESGYASKLIQQGWETITEALKHGGITNMMDRLSNPAKLAAFYLAEDLKEILTPLFEKHMDDIMSGEFSRTMAMALRLFGNMMSQNLLVAVLLSIVPLFLPAVLDLFGLLIGQVQAYIFAVLATVYIISGGSIDDKNEEKSSPRGV